MNDTEIIFGLHASIAALQNPSRTVFSLKCTQDFFNKNKKLIESSKPKQFEIVKRKVIDLELENTIHQGILLKCRKLKKSNLDSIDLNEKLIIILDSLNDSQNVGSILRSALMFGVKTIIYNKNNSFEINPFLIKASSGAYEKTKLIEVVNLNKTIEWLKKRDFWIVGFDIKSNNSLKDVPADTKKAIVFGSENKGIRSLISKNCDFLTKINMPGGNQSINSLNVSNSVAIALYEYTRK
tara:strand:- start:133 stop:849 length:717 start_codon:yes stop_codon:yes gene_type:complete